MTLGNRTKEEVNYFFLLVVPSTFWTFFRGRVRAAAVMIMVMTTIIATFRLEYEDDYEYESKVLSTRTSKIFALQA